MAYKHTPIDCGGGDVAQSGPIDSNKSELCSFIDLIGSYDSGRLAARNPLRVLNHLSLSSQRDAVAKLLGIHREAV